LPDSISSTPVSPFSACTKRILIESGGCVVAALHTSRHSSLRASLLITRALPR
jgi:hypothetical protein